MCPDQGITVTQDRIAREGGARAERAGQARERLARSTSSMPRTLMKGNEVIGAAAIRAGCTAPALRLPDHPLEPSCPSTWPLTCPRPVGLRPGRGEVAAINMVYGASVPACG